MVSPNSIRELLKLVAVHLKLIWKSTYNSILLFVSFITFLIVIIKNMAKVTQKLMFSCDLSVAVRGAEI